MSDILNKGAIEKIAKSQNHVGIKFYHVTMISDDINLNSFSFTNPTGSSSNNINMLLGGFTRIITINFLLKDDGTDKRTNTSIHSPRITLNEQWKYITDNVVQNKDASSQDKNYNIYWQLTLPAYNGELMVYNGMIESISLNPFQDKSPILLSGRLSFKIGINPWS